MKLNENQKKAVETQSNKVLVVAGPGTGKTRVITERVKWLVETQNIPMNSIMVLSFSHKAAGELIERLNKYDLKSEWIGTFHSICFKLLIFYGNYGKMKIIDDQDQQQILEKLNIKTLTPDKISSIKDGIMENHCFSNEIDKYNEFLRQNDMIDFADLINHTIELLQSNPNLQHNLNEKFSHIMIDEYQDTSEKQNILIELLSKNTNLFCVGDDDQSIYGWRGANVKNIINFSKKDNVEIINLDHNYRSTTSIIDAANKIIAFNRNRIKKSPWTKNSENNKIIVCCSSNESKFIMNQINQIKSNNNNCSIGILLRTGSLVRDFKAQFDQMGLKTVLKSGINFFQRKEIKIILNYLRAIKFDDFFSLEYIINIPKRGIGPKKISIMNEMFNNNESIDNIIKTINEDFYHQWINIKSFNYNSCDQIIEYILNLIFTENNYFNSEEISNINLLIDRAKSYNNLEHFLQDTMIGGAIEQECFIPQIMTIHGAKGLEFDYLFLPSMTEGVFPNFRAMIESPEEERRLAYVAFTRAKLQLFISYNLQNARMASSFGPSRFIHNIPQSHVRFMIG